MQLSSDRNVRDLFGMSDTEISEIINKSRQAVNHGLEKANHYFRPIEWTAIYLYLKSKKHPALEILAEYLEDRYKDEPQTFRNIVSGLGNFQSQPDIVEVSVAYCILADYRYFRDQNPASLRWLFGLAADKGIALKIFTSSETDLDILGDDVSIVAQGAKDRNVNIAIDWLPEANQYPYFLCFNPADRTERYFVCAEDRFSQIDNVRGHTIFRIAQKHFPSPVTASPDVAKETPAG